MGKTEDSNSATPTPSPNKKNANITVKITHGSFRLASILHQNLVPFKFYSFSMNSFHAAAVTFNRHFACVVYSILSPRGLERMMDAL